MSQKIKPGDKFGCWTVIADPDSRYCTCRCRCGTVRSVYRSSLLSGKSKSCGCLREELDEARIDKLILNHKFGRLMPIKRLLDTTASAKNRQYLCKCDCGRTAIMTDRQLRFYHVKSCGCLRRENSAVLMDKIAEEGHDAVKRSQVDGTTTYSLDQRRSKNNTSGIKGVSRMKSGQYRAYINLRRRQIHLGCFDTLEEAEAARLEAEKIYYDPILKNPKNKN